ncbi:MAG: hypothetical protein Q8M18_10935 [Bradyrhizobium sp.]|nr:hypothetical protein [Bradyrhizobium sp.]
MLQISHQLAAYLRSRAGRRSTEITLAGTPRKRENLSRKDNEILVPRAIEILEAGHSSRFQFEGAVRHGLRSTFCLEGMTWSKADARASAIVSEALRRIGATRPMWHEGQPEWCQDGYTATRYVLCQRCGKPLDADARDGTKFCSRTCNSAAQSAFRWRLTQIEGEAGMRAVMAARTKSRQKSVGEYICEGCGTRFERLWKPQGYRFCSHTCSGKRKFAIEPRPCAQCGREFYPSRAHNQWCSPDCRRAGVKAYNKAYHAVPPPPERPCAICGRPFCPAKKNALYCSAACNNRAYRLRATIRCEAAE